MLVPVSRWSEVGIQVAHRHKHSNSKLILLFKRWGSQCSESSHSRSANCIECGSHRICINTKCPPASSQASCCLAAFPNCDGELLFTHSTLTHLCGLHTFKKFLSVPFDQDKFYPLKAPKAGTKIKYFYSRYQFSG